MCTLLRGEKKTHTSIRLLRRCRRVKYNKQALPIVRRLLLLLLLLLLQVVSSVGAYSSNTRMMITTRTATRTTLISRRRRSRNPFWPSSSSSSSSSPLSFSSGVGMSTDNKSHERQQQQQQPLEKKTNNNNNKKCMKIAVIGGGLAGLSTVYHLLEKTINNISNSSNPEEDEMMMTIQKITVWDRSSAVGMAGGASAVAGGLVHPLSPSGKLVHWGIQGLDATRRLVNVACRAAEKQQQQQQQQQEHIAHNIPVVLRHEILRLALTPQHVNQLVSTERALFSSNKNNNNKNDNSNNNDNNTTAYSTFSCRWLDEQEIAQRYYNNLSSSSTTATSDDAAAATNNHNDDGNDASSSGAKNNEKSNKRIIRGGLLMSGGGCQVLHVPSYLQALWLACLDLGQQGGVVVEWKKSVELLEKNNGTDDSPESCCWSRRLIDYDTIVLAAGSGMFGDLIPLPFDKEDDDEDDDVSALPVHLVRGQSIEMDIPPWTTATSGNIHPPFVAEDQHKRQQPALLCGKYVSPLPPSQNGHARILIGATHEFKADPMAPDQVVSFLRDATAPMVPSNLWPQHGDNDTDDGNNNGHCSVDGRLKITSGFRVQSQRGKHGRMPIIGRYRFQAKEQDDKENDAGRADGLATRSQNKSQNKKYAASWCHRPDQNVWIFTGLSSRGLLYHALYGDLLTDAILANDEQVLWARSPDLKWWQKKKK